ncbi:MAG: ATP-binding protein [Candidatus Latescibacteria bacterium]|nr:ATP-binding protein [Candidatus Latescibacterota bacterium]
MLTFSLAEPYFTPRAADELLPDFLRQLHQAQEGAALEVDLGEVAFIPPYGLIVLCLMGRYARTLCPQVQFRLPRSPQLRRYLGRMRFDRAVAGFADLSGPSLMVDLEREKPDSEALLELTRIEERVDVERVLGRIAGRVETILATELQYTPVEINRFKNVVAELCHNILDHSMNWGYVAVQRYQDPRTHAKYAVIGVGDLGIGIKKSLAQRYAVEEWTHAQAILNSLKKNCSRDPARGLGLYIVEQICRRYGGNLQIKSGDTRVYIRGHRHFEHRSAFFPGTLLSISLCQRQL